MYRVLVADDQSAVREALRMLLRSEGFEVETVSTVSVVLHAITLHEYDTLLIDLNYARDTTSGKEGMQLLEAIREIDDRLPVIVMTAWATVDLAVEAVKRGARDFIQKPWDDDHLIATIKTHGELYRALRGAQRLDAANKLLQTGDRMAFIAEAPAMRRVVDTISLVGPSDANVLITGEHGTGKEVVAQTLHLLSHRADKALIKVNTGGLPEGVFESELFGHVKGAFTDARADRIGRFELADGGTLFLDEIANVPLRQQAKLLRVLETGEVERVGSSRSRQVNARILSATNADLPAECAGGNFREDLFFRLNTVEIQLPPLRERREDLPALAAHFLFRHVQRYRKQIKGFSPEALERLMNHRWPGNVRELDHTVERAVIMCHDELIQLANLGLQQSQQKPFDVGEMSLEQVEALLISKALARYGGNVTQAAQVLGLSRGTFYRRMEKHGLYVPELRQEKA